MRRPPRLKATPRSRTSTTVWQSFYNSSRWKRASAAFRADPANVLCCDCLAAGKVVPSECTDHIRPHNGNVALFWDRSNWAARCWSCHSSKSRADATGKPQLRRGATVTGEPLDPRHPWNREPS